jgi:hypothetical protein
MAKYNSYVFFNGELLTLLRNSFAGSLEADWGCPIECR